MSVDKNNEENSLQSQTESLWEQQIPQFQKVAVACSGGLDSTVLFHIIYEIFNRKKNFQLAICHTNFGLRPGDSDLDQDFLQTLAQKHNVPLRLNSISQDQREQKKSKSTQDWARDLRYRHFRDLASEGWVIAIAHHKNDLAENILLRLARGTSPGSMAGLSCWDEPFWRPLLHHSRDEIEAYGARKNIEFRHDISNDSLAYSRNQIRHQILPVLEQMYPGAVSRIARCGVQSQELTSFCISQLTNEIEKIQSSGLEVTAFMNFPRTLRDLILSRAIGKARQGRKSLSYQFLTRIDTHLNHSPDQKLILTLPVTGDLLKIEKGHIRIVTS